MKRASGLSLLALLTTVIPLPLRATGAGAGAEAGAEKPSRELAITSAPLSSLHAESPASWSARRPQIRRQWLDRLGMPPPCPELQPKILRTDSEADHDRLLITYQTEPGVFTDAYLLLPHGLTGPAPAAVVFHATSPAHILQPVGLATSSTRHLARHLVRRGYVTLSPRCYIYGYADQTSVTRPKTPERGTRHFAAETTALLDRVPDWSGMGKMLRDGQRAVDYLLTRPEVDSRRIACVGHSLGAKEALYLMAFDERVAAGIASEGGIGLRSTNWDAVWYLGNRVPPREGGRDHHELLTLMAPRPFLILGGESADGTHTQPLVDAARRVYQLLGAPESLALRVHNRGHDIPDEVRESAYDWLDRVLRP